MQLSSANGVHNGNYKQQRAQHGNYKQHSCNYFQQMGVKLLQSVTAKGFRVVIIHSKRGVEVHLCTERVGGGGSCNYVKCRGCIVTAMYSEGWCTTAPMIVIYSKLSYCKVSVQLQLSTGKGTAGIYLQLSTAQRAYSRNYP